MKSDDVQRAVRVNPHDRVEGDAPSMGKVARMPGTGLPKGERRRRRKAEVKRSRRIRLGRKRRINAWTLTLSLVAVLVLGGGIWLGVYVLQFQDAGEDDSAVAIAGPAVELNARIVSKFPSLPQAEALALAKNALAIHDPELVGEIIRPGQASSAQVVDFMKGLTAVDGGIDSYEWLGSLDANRMMIDGVKVSFKSGELTHNRIAMLTPDASGKWRMDFEAFARTVSPSWNEILNGGAATAVVRVYFARDNYYNGIFSDDKEWMCFGLASPDTKEILLGYCKRGSSQARALKWIVSKTTRLNRATLELKRVEGAERRQFVVDKVLAEDWAMGEQPFDSGF